MPLACPVRIHQKTKRVGPKFKVNDKIPLRNTALKYTHDVINLFVLHQKVLSD